MVIPLPVKPIPPEIEDVFTEFRTCELSTLARDGTPITWPVATSYDPQAATFLLTTSIGLPAKAFNIRGEPRVALLFSDPTASGLESPPAVLVQGRGVVGDDVVSIDGLERYWQILWERQPMSRYYSLPFAKRFSDYYYMRLVITVRAERVLCWPNGDFTADAKVIVV